MEKLTMDVVIATVWEQISKNEQTTTLDVKRRLRDEGYFATQAEVSSMMREILENDIELTAESNGQYLIYKFDFNSYNNPDHDDYVEKSFDDEDELDNEDTFNYNNSFYKAAKKVFTLDLESVDKDELDRLGTEIANNIDDLVFEETDPEWIVFDKNRKRYHKYHKDLTRDNVRSRFASIEGIPIQDVRARRCKNIWK